MHKRSLVALVAMMLLAASAGCGSDSDTGATIRRVGSDYDTIQDAVDAAKPGDLVLIEAGTYHEAVEVKTARIVIRGEDRNRVVLDGRDELINGFEVTADQVAIENLTVRRYAINGIIFTGSYARTGGADDGPVGWRASYVTAANNGLYGLYAFGTGPGQFDHDYASGHPDSGIYVGQCRSCGAVVIDNVMERNAIGYENTNASGVTVARNIARHNRIGMTISSGDQELLAPQSGGKVVANLVTDNDEAEAPVTEGGFGAGIVIAGGQGNVVERNIVSGHPGTGIVVIDQDGYLPERNTVRANELTGNATDLAYVLESGEAPTPLRNCFADNRGSRSTPTGLQRSLPCDGSARAVPGTSLDQPEPPPPFDYRTVARPPKQPSRPGAPDGPWEIPSRTARSLATKGLEAPTG